MSGAALQGFVTGLATTLAKNVLENKQRARDYFDKQVEYARTKGLENRQRVQQQANANLVIAKQLIAAGVPEDLVKAQISANPENLEGFYTEVEKIRTQKDLTPEQWREIYKVSENYKAPDEDLATFVSRTYDPIANAVKDPTFEEDPEGSLWASMMGWNAMDQARARLGKTVVAEGLTADQLMRYGDSSFAKPDTGVTVVRNYAPLRKQADEEDEPSISETSAVSKILEERLGAALDQRRLLPDNPEHAGQVEETRQELVESLAQIFPTYPRSRIETMASIYLAERGYKPVDTGAITTSPLPTAPETATEAPSAPTMPAGSQEPEMAPSAPAKSLVEQFGARPPVIELPDEGLVLTFVSDNGDGSSTFIDQNGVEHQIKNEAAIAYYNQ